MSRLKVSHHFLVLLLIHKLKLKAICLIIFLFFISLDLMSVTITKEKLIGMFYVKTMYANIHEHPTIYSTSLSSIQCGQGVRVFQKKDLNNPAWFYIRRGNQKGYIKKILLSKKNKTLFSKKI